MSNVFEKFDKNFAFLDDRIGDDDMYLHVQITSLHLSAFIPEYTKEIGVDGEEQLYLNDDGLYLRVASEGIAIDEEYPTLVNTNICFTYNTLDVFILLIHWLHNQVNILKAVIYFSDYLYADFDTDLDYVTVISNALPDEKSKLLAFAAETKEVINQSGNEFIHDCLDKINESTYPFDELLYQPVTAVMVKWFKIEMELNSEVMNEMMEKFEYIKQNSDFADEVKIVLHVIADRSTWRVRFMKPVEFSMVRDYIAYLLQGTEGDTITRPVVTVKQVTGEKTSYTI